jgi:type IV pilus assembly protein PilE
MMRMTHSRGFTLIEVLIAVVIVGILAAVALPSYQNFMNKSRRADGKQLVTDLASRQERYFLQHNSYTTNITAANGLNASEVSDKGYYTAAVTACSGGSIATCFVVTANATGPQLERDTGCRTLSLSDTGEKTSTDSDDGASAGCW